MSRYVEIDMSEQRRFFNALEAAAKGGFRKELEQFLQGIGYEFLRIVQDEIIRRKVMDTRLLLSSFTVGDEGNVWEITDGGLTLEVGSSVKYAAWVNDGHKQEPGRFVPGYWEGDRFVYDRSAKGGMVLRASWVDGKPYWDSAIRILDKMLPDLLDRKIQEWLDNYF